jgi:hypothetical protein
MYCVAQPAFLPWASTPGMATALCGRVEGSFGIARYLHPPPTHCELLVWVRAATLFSNVCDCGWNEPRRGQAPGPVITASQASATRHEAFTAGQSILVNGAAWIKAATHVPRVRTCRTQGTSIACLAEHEVLCPPALTAPLTPASAAGSCCFPPSRSMYCVAQPAFLPWASTPGMAAALCGRVEGSFGIARYLHPPPTRWELLVWVRAATLFSIVCDCGWNEPRRGQAPGPVITASQASATRLEAFTAGQSNAGQWSRLD